MNSRRWIVDSVGQVAFDALTQELAGATLQSLLLTVMEQRAAGRSPADVLAQYRRDGFCRPAAADLRVMTALDAQLLSAAVGFDAIELAPVAPLGTCSTVALTHQNRVLSALRATELVSDPTNVLALECADRLRAAPATAVHLTTSQRVVRAQPVPKLPGYAPHFRIFVLASGGIEHVDHAFTVDALVLHVRTMLRALERLEQHGYAFGARRVEVLSTPARAALADRVAAQLGEVAQRKPLEHGYYAGLRYMIWVTAPDGQSVPLIDGGAFDWLARLTSNRRAVYIASGAGSQLMALRFAVGASP